MTEALKNTTFVFQPLTLTEDQVYALLTDNESGVLFPPPAPEGVGIGLMTASANPVANTGAMVALIPSRADLERLAMDGGEPMDDLHLTLAFLGLAALIPHETRHQMIQTCMQYFREAITTEAFSVNVFNPHTEDRPTAIVLGIRGEDLVQGQGNVMSAVQGAYSGMPDNHKPWIPHVTLKYADDLRKEDPRAYASKLGPITFDTLRFAFGDEVVDIPLAPLTASVNRMPYAPPAETFDDIFTAAVAISHSDVEEPVEMVPTLAAWDGIITVEGIESGDGRMFKVGSLDWATLPLPLMYQPANVGGHSGSIMVGQITNVFRDGNRVYGAGVIDLAAKTTDGFEVGKEVFRLMSEGFMTGVSVDVDKVKDADVELMYGTLEPKPFDKPTMTVFNRGRVRGATLVAFPAFDEARVHLSGEVLTASAVGLVLTHIDFNEIITAASHTIVIPDLPPAWWFSKPVDVELRGAFTITDEGRIYGLLAPAGVTHRSVNKKVPRNVDYSRFMGKETLVAGADGSTGRVKTGVITFNCGHASADPAVYGTLDNRITHYDNSCSVFADITIGEDERGTWVAGAVKPYATGEQIQRAMSCTLSGDWQPHRDKPGITDFVAALLVPVPGFAMARKEASVRLEDGALVASSIPVEYSPSALLTAAARKKEIYRKRIGKFAAKRKLELAQKIGRTSNV